ncbi:hypothetical protein BH09ACT8_BH09ACT8_61550 [soil metagenome]
MDFMGTAAVELPSLILAAIDRPETADLNRLLTSASELLDMVNEGDPALLPLVRYMAFAACDYAVFRTDPEPLRDALYTFFNAYSAATAADA